MSEEFRGYQYALQDQIQSVDFQKIIIDDQDFEATSLELTGEFIFSKRPMTEVEISSQNQSQKLILFGLRESMIYKIEGSNDNRKYESLDCKYFKMQTLKSNDLMQQHTPNQYHNNTLVLSNKFWSLYFFSEKTEQVAKWEQMLLKYTIQEQINTKYSIQRLISSKEESSFYLAKRSSMGQQTSEYVYLKQLNKVGINGDKTTFDKINNEISIYWKLAKCGNILRMQEIFEDENNIYLVFENLKGNLTQIASNKKQFNEEQTKFVMEQLLLALDFIHSKGIIHRDIQLDNILIGQIDRDLIEVKIIDLGSAKFGASSASEDKFLIQMNSSKIANCDTMKQIGKVSCNDETGNEIVGSPGWIAPEGFTKNKYSAKQDIFSLGVLFYHLLTGTQLFEGNDQNEILKNNRECNLQHIGVGLLKVSQVAKNLLFQLLQRDPAMRPSAEEALQHTWFQKDHQILDDLLGLSRRESDHFSIHSGSQKNPSEPVSNSQSQLAKCIIECLRPQNTVLINYTHSIPSHGKSEDSNLYQSCLDLQQKMDDLSLFDALRLQQPAVNVDDKQSQQSNFENGVSDLYDPMIKATPFNFRSYQDGFYNNMGKIRNLEPNLSSSQSKGSFCNNKLKTQKLEEEEEEEEEEKYYKQISILSNDMIKENQSEMHNPAKIIDTNEDDYGLVSEVCDIDDISESEPLIQIGLYQPLNFSKRMSEINIVHQYRQFQ